MLRKTFLFGCTLFGHTLFFGSALFGQTLFFSGTLFGQAFLLGGFGFCGSLFNLTLFVLSHQFGHIARRTYASWNLYHLSRFEHVVAKRRVRIKNLIHSNSIFTGNTIKRLTRFNTDVTDAVGIGGGRSFCRNGCYAVLILGKPHCIAHLEQVDVAFDDGIIVFQPIGASNGENRLSLLNDVDIIILAIDLLDLT